MYTLLLVNGQNKVSSAAHLESGIDLINSASCGENKPSIKPWSHYLVSPLIKISTLASAIVSTLCDWTCGIFFLGSQWSCLILTAFPFPILHWQPLSNTSLPCKMLLQAWEPLLDHLASIKVQFGKNRTLKTLCSNEYGFFKSLHACLAIKESLNIATSLNPMPPSNFDLVSSSHFNQWIFLFSPLCPHQNFLIMVSISWQRPKGILKQPIA